jgi:type I restriction enzyme S subunit
MEVKPRYKQTDVGAIPEDWHTKRMDEITVPQRPISYGIVQTGPNVLNGVPCLRVLDINEGRINKAELITTTRKISDSYKRTVLREGDLVMPLRGKVGDVGIVDHELDGANLTRGVALIAIRPPWSGPFCRQLLSWSATRKRLEQTMNGSALQEIPIATLRSFQVGLPSSSLEQHAIATVLIDVDALLDALDRLIAKKRDLKQAAMQQLLAGQTRLPGFHGEWKTTHLGECASFRTGPFGSALHKSDYTDDGVPVVNPMHIVEGRIESTRTMTVTEAAARNLADFRLKPGEIVMGRRGDMGRCAVVQPHQSGWLCGTGSMIIRAESAVRISCSECYQALMRLPRLRRHRWEQR